MCNTSYTVHYYRFIRICESSLTHKYMEQLPCVLLCLCIEIYITYPCTRKERNGTIYVHGFIITLSVDVVLFNTVRSLREKSIHVITCIHTHLSYVITNTVCSATYNDKTFHILVALHDVQHHTM